MRRGVAPQNGTFLGQERRTTQRAIERGVIATKERVKASKGRSIPKDKFHRSSGAAAEQVSG